MKIIYRVYQLFIAAPLLLLATALTSIVVILGCTLGNAHVWGYYPGMVWSRFFCWILLLPVRVKGRECLEKGQSYVFVANHQGDFDIFLIYGYLGRNFKWMMKKSLRNIPLVGKACADAGHIFVDKRGPKAIQHTYDQARQVLRGGTSLVVFPEGARTFTGHMGFFRKGAFQLAEEIELPVVPITINGSFQVLPRMKGVDFIHWHPLEMTIHAPIPTKGIPQDQVMEQAYDAIMQGLPADLQGFVKNDDQ